MRSPLPAKGQPGRVAVGSMNGDVLRPIEDSAFHGVAGGVEIAGDFRLAVDGDALAAGEAFKIDALHPAAEGQANARMGQAFPVQPRAHAGGAKQVAGPLLQHARPDARHHIGPRLAFQDDRLYASQMQNLAQ